MYKREINITVDEDEVIPKKYNISIAMPKDQAIMSVKEITHTLIGSVSMMIKSCEHNEVGIKDYELLEEVIEHLNSEFGSIKSYNDLYTNEVYIKKTDEE